MGRGKSALTYTTSTGVTRGIAFTERDEAILREVTRWYALTAVQLYRYMNRFDKHLWHPAFGAPDDVFVRGTPSWNGAQRLRERLGKFRLLDAKPQSGVGPFVDSVWMSRTSEAWYTMPLGARYAGLDGWVTKKYINDQSVRHADAACAIGTQLESYGWRVASERELRRGMLIDGTTLGADFTSIYRPPGTATQVRKHPDLAILSPDGDRYIAVEIERSKYRPVDVYIEKFKAYSRNPSIDAVWYVCVDENTKDRVARAAEQVFKGPENVYAVTADMSRGFWDLPYLYAEGNPEQQYDATLAKHLNILLERRSRRGITVPVPNP